MAQRQQSGEMRVTRQMSGDPSVVAAGASVALALYYYFVRGDHDRGLFVGLWAPTILAFANHFEHRRTRGILDETLGSGALRRTVQRVVQGTQ